MTTYKNVRNFTKAWAKKTYAEGELPIIRRWRKTRVRLLSSKRF